MTAPEPQTHVLSQGGLQTLKGLRRQLKAEGIRSELVCPPGVDPGR
ncbi:MAG: hypothetical protein AAF726_19070 [Planctomycetota bacterium]